MLTTVHAKTASMSLFVAASKKLPGARNPEGQILTDGFLDVCQLVVPVIGKLDTPAAATGLLCWRSGH